MNLEYQGTELELFAQATHWKSYLARRIARFVRGNVLEVGAGMGANTRHLITPDVTRWTALEPDARLAARARELIQADPALSRCKVACGTLADLPAEDRFDTILYIDVLEHIADDRTEVAAAMGRVLPGGHLVVLCPAYQFLFSPFDTAVGHHRRYGLDQLRRLTPAGARIADARMLDSVGLVASLANWLLLHQDRPTTGQIRIWDRLMVPLSRLVDPLTAFRLGKSVLIVWQSPS